MLDDAFFVSSALHERPVTLADGSTHLIHFRELSATQLRAYQLAEQSEDEQVRSAAIAKLIAASVCNPDGTPAMTYERAQLLKPKPANALMAEILKLNDVAKGEAKKPSPPEAQSGSGTS